MINNLIKSNSRESLAISPISVQCRENTRNPPPTSPLLGDLSHPDVNQSIFDEDAICDTIFGRIFDSPPTPLQNTNEALTYRSNSPLSQTLDRTDTPYYPPIRPLHVPHSISSWTPQTNTYTHSVLNTDSYCDPPVPTYHLHTLCPSARHAPPYESCCLEHRPQSMYHSPLEQRHYSHPGCEGTHRTHTCTCKTNSSIYPAPLSRHSHMPSEDCEYIYSPVGTRRSLSQPVSIPVTSDSSQAHGTRSSIPDQFKNITPSSSPLPGPISRKSTFQALSPPNDLPLPTYSTPIASVCVNCCCENRFVESGECDAHTLNNCQIQLETFRESTQEGSVNECLEDSLCSSQLSCTQGSIFSDSSFDRLSRETPDLDPTSIDKEKHAKSQKRKEQRKLNCERERKRAREINRAFQDLGDVCCLHTNERAQTKVATIEQAVIIIQKLQDKITCKKIAESNQPTEP